MPRPVRRTTRIHSGDLRHRGRLRACAAAPAGTASAKSARRTVCRAFDAGSIEPVSRRAQGGWPLLDTGVQAPCRAAGIGAKSWLLRAPVKRAIRLQRLGLRGRAASWVIRARDRAELGPRARMEPPGIPAECMGAPRIPGLAVRSTCLIRLSREFGIHGLSRLPYPAGPLCTARLSSALTPILPSSAPLPYAGVRLRRARNSSTTPPITAMPP